MATAEIHYPHGQHAKVGEKIELNIRYTGPAPNPDDAHIYVKDIGDTYYPDKPAAGWDIDPTKARDQGLTLNWPVGSTSGTYDFRIDWTWKTPGAAPKLGGEGQYFADKKPIESGWCIWFIMILMALGGLVGGFALGPSLIGYLIGLAAGFGLGVLLCILFHGWNR